MSKSMNEIFSTNLRNTLYMAGTTQAELAKAVGVTEVSVSKWINGQVVPRPKNDRISCDYNKLINQETLENWLLENIEEDFKVNVTLKAKKKEDPAKYRNQLKRLNDVYVMGNIPETEYRKRSADLQRKIADLSKEQPKKEVFKKGWKEVYLMLDAKHRKAFWQNLIKEIHINEDKEVTEILY